MRYLFGLRKELATAYILSLFFVCQRRIYPLVYISELMNDQIFELVVQDILIKKISCLGYL